MNSCNNECHGNRGSGYLFVLVVYILLVIIIGSNNNSLYF